MTTEPETSSPIDPAMMWRAIGQMEGKVEALIESHNQLREEQRQMRDDMREGFRVVNLRMDQISHRMDQLAQRTDGRIDRLYYAGLVASLGLVAAIFASRFLG